MRKVEFKKPEESEYTDCVIDKMDSGENLWTDKNFGRKDSIKKPSAVSKFHSETPHYLYPTVPLNSMQNNPESFVDRTQEIGVDQYDFVLKNMKTFLDNNQDIYFFEHFSVENLWFMGTTARDLKKQYQRELDGVVRFVKGLRSFIRFKISTDQKTTITDYRNFHRQNNNVTAGVKMMKTNPWISLYNDLAPPMSQTALHSKNLQNLEESIWTSSATSPVKKQYSSGVQSLFRNSPYKISNFRVAEETPPKVPQFDLEKDVPTTLSGVKIPSLLEKDRNAGVKLPYS
jgi:hypothetical protein